MAKVIKCDSRGQMVIPKGIRKKLGIDKEGAFWVYNNEDSILLKMVQNPTIPELKKSLKKLRG